MQTQRRCEVTGNLCGTDLWATGYVCPCPECRTYMREKFVHDTAFENPTTMFTKSEAEFTRTMQDYVAKHVGKPSG